MSYTLVKNLKVNKKTGVISGEFAESNVTDYAGRRIYEKVEDIYNNKEGTRSPLEKYSRFIFDVISGGLQGSLGKYNRLSVSNYYNDCQYFMAKYPDKDPYVLTYNKYEDFIEKQLKSESKNYIVKFNSNRDVYLEKLNTRTYRTCYNENHAQKFELKDISRLKRIFEDKNPNIKNIVTNEIIPLKEFIVIDNQPKLEIETAYNLKIPSNKEFKELSSKFKNLSQIINTFSNKDLDENTIQSFYSEQIKEILGTNPFKDNKINSLFGFYENTESGPKILSVVSPELNKSSYTPDGHENPSFYLSYKIECNDLATGLTKTYNNNHFIIDHILDNENETKQILLWQEKDFINELQKEIHKRENENCEDSDLEK